MTPKILCSLTALAVAAASPHALGQSQSKGESGPSMEMHQSMMKGAKESMSMKPSGDMDHDFVSMMRHHHQMGVQMAEKELKNGKDEQAKEFARKIAESQRQEIKEFDVWLKSHKVSKK